MIKFGTDGWRGIIAEDFTFKNVRIVTQAIASYLKKRRTRDEGRGTKTKQTPSTFDLRPSTFPSIVVGYDTRFLSKEFAKASAEVLMANKIAVYFLIKPFPTPVTAYSVKVYKASGAIMITASHNHPHYNGIKFIPESSSPASPEITTAIERNIQQRTKDERRRTETKQISSTFDLRPSTFLRVVDPTKAYVNHLKNLVDFETIRKSRLKVVVDPMYGAGLNLMPHLLEEVGLRFKTIHNFSDPLFGGALPDPNLANLKELAKKVLAKKADLGLALDGDGDRFGVIDEEGRYFTPNQILPLIAFHLLKNRGLKGAVVRSVATTHLLDKIAAFYGAEVIETPVGFKYVGEAMLKRPVVLGGEESGGLSILGHIPEKDGLLAGLLVAEALVYEKKPLGSILKKIFQEFGFYSSMRLDIEVPKEKKEKLLKNLKASPPASAAGLKVEEIICKDGIKLLLADGSWLLIRPSGTEPLIRVYIESSSQSRLKKLKNFASRLLKI